MNRVLLPSMIIYEELVVIYNDESDIFKNGLMNIEASSY